MWFYWYTAQTKVWKYRNTLDVHVSSSKSCVCVIILQVLSSFSKWKHHLLQKCNKSISPFKLTLPSMLTECVFEAVEDKLLWKRRCKLVNKPVCVCVCLIWWKQTDCDDQLPERTDFAETPVWECGSRSSSHQAAQLGVFLGCFFFT